MEELLYWYKPYLLYAMGFICMGLDHPIKWVSVILLILASLCITYARFKNNRTSYEEIQIKGVVNVRRTEIKRKRAFA